MVTTQGMCIACRVQALLGMWCSSSGRSGENGRCILGHRPGHGEGHPETSTSQPLPREGSFLEKWCLSAALEDIKRWRWEREGTTPRGHLGWRSCPGKGKRPGHGRKAC